jgi:hypothetical protein
VKHEAYDDRADLGKCRNRQVAQAYSFLQNHLAKVRSFYVGVSDPNLLTM